MNETITNEALDLIVFADDEASCEIRSNHTDCACSVSATHRIMFECSDEPALICHNLANVVNSWLSDPGNDCEECDRVLSECWKVIPV